MDKGKGKVPSGEGEHDAPQQSSSFFEKLGNSARGLARDTVMPAPQVAADIQGSIGESNKGGSALSASRPVGVSQNALQDTVGSSSSLQRPPARGIKISSAREPNLEDIDLDQWSQQGLQDGLVKHHMATRVDNGPGRTLLKNPDLSDEASMQTAWDYSRQNRVSGFDSALQSTDGAEVVNLLSDRSFQPEMWGEEDLVDEDRPLTTTAEERAISNRFLQLTEGRTRHDLATAFDRSVQIDSSAGSHQQTLTFFDDLHNYHEDVWGYLKPIVAQARTELREGRSVKDSPAVARLQMILGHIDPSRLQ